MPDTLSLEDVLQRWSLSSGLSFSFHSVSQDTEGIDLSRVTDLDFCVEDHAAYYLGTAIRLQELTEFFTARNPSLICWTGINELHTCLGSLVFHGGLDDLTGPWEKALLRFLDSGGAIDTRLDEVITRGRDFLTEPPGIPAMVILPKS